MKKIAVSIIMGSDSDYSVMKEAAKILKSFGISFETKIVSAHRTPKEMVTYSEELEMRGVQVVIAGAGGAAHLPGMVASLTSVPVIGVPVPVGPLSGKDALYSIVQMPTGVPVATVAIGNSANAALLAIKIIAFGGPGGDSNLKNKLNRHREDLRKKVIAKKLPR